MFPDFRLSPYSPTAATAAETTDVMRSAATQLVAQLAARVMTGGHVARGRCASGRGYHWTRTRSRGQTRRASTGVDALEGASLGMASARLAEQFGRLAERFGRLAERFAPCRRGLLGVLPRHRGRAERLTEGFPHFDSLLWENAKN